MNIATRIALILFATYLNPASAFAEASENPSASTQSTAFVVSAPSLFIGVQLEMRASRLSRKLTGLRVKEVSKDSMAYAAGLRPKDMIVSWNGVLLTGRDPAFIKTLKTESKDGVISVMLGVQRKKQKAVLPIELALKEIDGQVSLKPHQQ